MTHEDYKKEIIEKYLELKKIGFFANKKEERRKNDEEFKAKYGISFFEKFGIESISLLKDKDLLYHLFQDKDDSTNSIGLTRALEYYMPDYGSFTGTDWSKSPVSYSANKQYPEQGRLWRDFTGNAISEQEAIKIAEKTKEKLIQLYNYLKNGDLESFYQECPNDRYYRFYHKYLYMFYPNILTSYHSKDFAKNHKVKLNLHESQKLALEKYFWEIKKQFNLSDASVDDLRLTVEELWGVGIAATAFNQMNPKQYRSTEIYNKKIEQGIKQPLNQILYGPPGTGKTYNTVIKAIEITNPELIQRDKDGNVENYETLKNKFDELKQQSQIEFVTFHQSYSYEEFVEGIKPYTPEWGTVEENNRFVGQDGIFKKICKLAERNLYVFDEDQKADFDKIYKIFQEKYETGSSFSNLLNIKYEQNNLVYHYGAQSQDRRIDLNRIKELFNSGKQYSTAIEFNKDYKGNTALKGYFFNFYQELLQIKNEYIDENIIDNRINQDPLKYVLVIDEINRGDVSKIFGELITLIEEDKRIGKEHQMTVTLPYSREPFGVPNNLYIIGTMNTADRSIALLDTALRRRFDFEEMMPKPEKIVDENKQPQMVEDINLQNLLKNINERISHILDRDHQIGHSYFIGVKNKEQLERAYKNRILPLLNEYFYNDIDSVAKILNCNSKEVNLIENWFDVLKEAQKPTKKDNEQ